MQDEQIEVPGLPAIHKLIAAFRIIYFIIAGAGSTFTLTG